MRRPFAMVLALVPLVCVAMAISLVLSGVSNVAVCFCVGSLYAASGAYEAVGRWIARLWPVA